MKLADGGIATGTVLVGKYRVDGILGQGGMGMVYRAHHLTLDEPVAIKVLRRDVSKDEETVTRFAREAQAAVRLKSEHVARIHDVGTFEDGLPFIVMELLEGADLGQLVEANGAMVPHAAVDLVLQACDAIAEAHSLEIVHRDIKPTNLYVSFRPDQSAIVKVLDFGISKSASGDLSLTQTSSVLGTPAYMSPEQMRSARSVDARTDIWSLGTVLYELLEARPPFRAESFSELCIMVATDPPAPMTLAPELAPIIQRCLAKHPDQRYANVAELTIDLARYAGDPEAARRHVTRTHRVLGLGVPSRIDTNPAIVRLGGYEYTPASIPVTSARSMHSGPAVMAPTLVDGPSRSIRRVMLGAVLATLLGVGGALGLLELLDAEPEPARPEGRSDAGARTVILPLAGSASADGSGSRSVELAGPRAGSAPTTGSAAADPALMSAGSAAGSGTGSGASASSSAGADANTIHRRPKQSLVRPPPRPPRRSVADTPRTGAPPPKPRCDPFASRRGCT